MTQTDSPPARDGRTDLSDPGDRRALGAVRIAIGLAQGLFLFWMYRSAGDGSGASSFFWPATQPVAFAPLLLAGAYLPVVALAGVGALRLRTLIVWLVVAGISLALLGWHDVARQALSPDATPPFLDFIPLPFIAVALFIAHHLIVPADRARRWIAPYTVYFDAAWKSGVQLALSLGFTGAFWILLFLGAALFRVIGLDVLNDLIGESWFSIPVTCVVFAVAVHLTDVRDGLIRGVRSVALMLLSWLLPVLALLTAAFILALPFTGLDGLWNTGSATALVLAAAGLLIILINAAYQDGAEDNRPPVALRIAGRVGAVLLTPLIVIAAWGLALRIGQHGLTPDRIVAVACAVVGAAYAVGYGAAVVRDLRRRGGWMDRLERTNVAVAALAVVTILALFSPVADPNRLSADDQAARLERGAVAPDAFDYAFLRFEAGRAGLRALDRLARSDDAEIARRATEARAAPDSERYAPRFQPAEPEVIPVVAPWPQDAQLPQGFIGPVATADPRRDCDAERACLAVMRDLNGDGADEVLMADAHGLFLFAQQPDGDWRLAATYRGVACGGDIAGDPRVALREGRLASAPQPWPDLSLGDGAPLRMTPPDPCLVNP